MQSNVQHKMPSRKYGFRLILTAIIAIIAVFLVIAMLSYLQIFFLSTDKSTQDNKRVKTYDGKKAQVLEQLTNLQKTPAPPRSKREKTLEQLSTITNEVTSKEKLQILRSL